MRRFFQVHRDGDYGQIQYLTAKCTRLAHEKAVLEREFVLSREKERKLQKDLEAVTTRLLHQEETNLELRMKQEQLINTSHQQQDLVDLLQQRVVLLVQDGSRDAELLQQVGSELLCLQSSEVQLGGLVQELHAEAQHCAAEVEDLQVELHSKTVEIQMLQDTNKSLAEELQNIRDAHQKEVRELQQENEGSVRKLQETAVQFEWLCQQQRYWICCVKRFKDSLLKEREALQGQVSKLKQKKKAEKLKKNSHDDNPAQSLLCPLQDTERYDSSITLCEPDAVVDLESRMEKSNALHEDFFNQAGSPINGYQKPP